MAGKLCYKIILKEEIDGDVYERTMIVFTNFNEARKFMKNYAIKAGFILGTSYVFEGEKNNGTYYYKKYGYMNMSIEFCELTELVDEYINESVQEKRLHSIADMKIKMNRLFHECIYNSKYSRDFEGDIPF